MVHRITIFAFGMLLAASAEEVPLQFHESSDCECGVSGEEVSNRIVGGKISIPHAFPWVTPIFLGGFLHCGGSLINDRYILTAGHCVNGVKNEDLTIGLGMHDIENVQEGYTVSVEKSILHEKFSHAQLHDTNDIALIKLKHPVNFTENVRPVCLPANGSHYTNQDVKVTGWGLTADNGIPSRYLRETVLKVMSFSMCRNTTLGEHITESMICGYNDNKDTCQGDSGGPLLYKRPNGKYEVIGLVSWGIGCATKDIPGVYVKNTYYLNWIKNHSNDGIFCTDKHVESS